MATRCPAKLRRSIVLLVFAISLLAGALLTEALQAKSPPLAQKSILNSVALAAQIDQHVDRTLEAKGIPVSPRADDAEFLRRIYLDVTGVIPPLDRIEPFFADATADKRSHLIDELLCSEEYARHMTDQWREYLIPNTAAAARRRHETGIVWLEEAFRTNRPYHEFVRGVLTADGMQRDSGASTFLLTHQSLDEVTDRLSRVLLGVQITCAQCHDHPFADWKQSDYWGTAAFFSKVKHQYERINNVEHYGVSEKGDRKPLMVPPSFQATPPTFLGGVQPMLDQEQPYLPVFVDWLATSDNPYFAQAFVNRLWRKLMGRGLVEPVDDLRHDNPGTHPELLALLAEQFRHSGFDIHYLIRSITLSQAYQRTSKPLEGNQDDRQYYSHAPIKVMTPHGLHDSVQTVMRLGDSPPPMPKDPPPQLSDEEKVKASIRSRGQRDSFANFFKGEENPSPVAYEAGLPQALRLMNAQEMQRGSRVVAFLARKSPQPESIVSQLYLAVLSRHPSSEERAIALDYIQAHSEPTKVLADVAWALLNSTEFVTIH